MTINSWNWAWSRDMAQILHRKFFLQFETSCLWQVAQMKNQGILEQRPVMLRRTLSLLKLWAFTCRHESRFSSAGAVRASVCRWEACEQTAAPADREACEQTAVQAHREASRLTKLHCTPSSQLLPLLMSSVSLFKINPALPGITTIFSLPLWFSCRLPPTSLT